MSGQTGSYPVSADTYYGAKTSGLQLFLKEKSIPGKAYDFLSKGKRYLVDIEVRKTVDKRLGAVPKADKDFFIEQISNIWKALRISNLDSEAAERATEYLQKAKDSLESIGD